MYVCACMHVYECVHAHVCVYTRGECVCMSLCVYSGGGVHMCVCVCVCLCTPEWGVQCPASSLSSYSLRQGLSLLLELGQQSDSPRDPLVPDLYNAGITESWVAMQSLLGACWRFKLWLSHLHS